MLHIDNKALMIKTWSVVVWLAGQLEFVIDRIKWTSVRVKAHENTKKIYTKRNTKSSKHKTQVAHLGSVETLQADWIQRARDHPS